jgi:hypothetical protein
VRQDSYICARVQNETMGGHLNQSYIIKLSGTKVNKVDAGKLKIKTRVSYLIL